MISLRTLGDNAVALTALFALGGSILVADRKVQAMERDIETGRTTNDKQDQAIAVQTKVISDLLELTQESNALMTSVYRRGLIIEGQAEVMGAGEEPYIELNTWGNGTRRLMEFDEIRVTNRDHPDQHSVVLEVRSTFSNQTPGFVIKCSRAAAELLHARNGWVSVILEPVFAD